MATDIYKCTILLVDDEPVLNKTLCAVLRGKGYKVKSALTGKEALEILNQAQKVDLVILDIRLPDINGVDILREAKTKYPDIVVILITAFASVDTAIAAIKEGAYTYLTKPFEADELLMSVQRALEERRLGIENKKLLSNLSLLYKIGKELEGIVELYSISNLAVNYFQDMIKPDVCALLLLDQETQEFYFGALTGYEYKIETLAARRFKIEPEMHKKLLEEHNAILIPQLKTKPHILEYIPVKDAKSLFIFPLVARNKTVGLVLFIGCTTIELNEEDLETISTISSEIAVCIENAYLYLKLKQNYLSAVAALVKAIEAKDKYTRGHSEMVADLAALVATHLNLSKDEVEAIWFSGLLHDVGKISISEQILLKKGVLTQDEYTAIKMHCIVSTSIVRRIDVNNRLTPIILYHHERFDGSGYPEGLQQDAIPIGARVLSVCDAYEAMISERPYRKALSKEEAISELSRCAGAQFDPKVVEVFIAIISKQ